MSSTEKMRWHVSQGQRLSSLGSWVSGARCKEPPQNKSRISALHQPLAHQLWLLLVGLLFLLKGETSDLDFISVTRRLLWFSSPAVSQCLSGSHAWFWKVLGLRVQS